MKAPACNDITYTHRTCALHLHEYRGEVVILGRRIELEPGDITLSPPAQPSRYTLAESGHHFCAHFLPPPAGGRRIHVPVHLRPGSLAAVARERFWRIIDYCRQASDDPHSPAGCAASAALQEFLLWLHLQSAASERPRRASEAADALEKLCQVIDASLHKPVTVPGLAARGGMSADYLARLFRQRYGMTILHYILLRRIEVARHLLRSSRMPIQEIAWQAGIPDAQYFNKQFRRITGQSPTAYRLRCESGEDYGEMSPSFRRNAKG
jgi:AraC-like DNA-binding protein